MAPGESRAHRLHPGLAQEMLSDAGRIPDPTRCSRRADAEARGAARRCWTIRATRRATRIARVGATARRGVGAARIIGKPFATRREQSLALRSGQSQHSDDTAKSFRSRLSQLGFATTPEIATGLRRAALSVPFCARDLQPANPLFTGSAPTMQNLLFMRRAGTPLSNRRRFPRKDGILATGVQTLAGSSKPCRCRPSRTQ
jgi:hypothetical protein